MWPHRTVQSQAILATPGNTGRIVSRQDRKSFSQGCLSLAVCLGLVGRKGFHARTSHQLNSFLEVRRGRPREAQPLTHKQVV
jgi:hypothetical protein